jgi:hypothetical protein
VNRTVSPQARRARRFGLLGAFLLATAILAAIAPSAPADLIKPAVVLGPTTVANGTAVVSGTLGLLRSNADLRINGQPVAIDADGHFAGTVNLNGQSSLVLSARNQLTGETMTTTIPLTTDILGAGGLISPGVLSALEDAAVTILKPLGGFQVVDGEPLQVSGSVLNKDNLAALRVNGMDVLGQVGPDSTFGAQIAGTTKALTLTVTDRQGVEQATVIPVEHVAAPAAPVGRFVNAHDAVGVRIASVRYRLRNIRRTKRLRVVVTIKDRRGLLVRNAAVGVRSARARWIARNPRAKRTNASGQSAFIMTVRNRSFGRRLVLRIVTKTPHAKARKTSAVRLPRLSRTSAAKRK